MLHASLPYTVVTEYSTDAQFLLVGGEVRRLLTSQFVVKNIADGFTSFGLYYQIYIFCPESFFLLGSEVLNEVLVVII